MPDQELSKAARDVLAERQRQISEEGNIACLECPRCSSEIRPTQYSDYFACRNGHIVSGKVWRGKTQLRVVAPIVRKARYSFVRVSIRGKRKTVDVHILVAFAFHGERPFPSAEVRHLNGKQHDNASENLAWGNRREQTLDQVRHGTNPVGSRNGNSTLMESQVLEIKHRLSKGESPTSIAPEYGCSRATIYDIRHGRKWTHVEIDRLDRAEARNG